MVPQADQREVLAAGQQLVDSGVLTGQPDQVAQRGGVGNHVAARHARTAAVGSKQRREDAHERRLSGAVGPEQGQHAAFLGDEIDATERDRRTEALRDRLYLDHRCAHNAPCHLCWVRRHEVRGGGTARGLLVAACELQLLSDTLA